VVVILRSDKATGQQGRKTFVLLDCERMENIENIGMIWRLPLQGQESVIAYLDCGVNLFQMEKVGC